MFTLKEIIQVCDAKLLNRSKTDSLVINRVSIDSRQMQGADLFIAIKGDRFDGHNFVKEAVRAGAEVILIDNPRAFRGNIQDEAYLLVKDTVKALGKLAKLAREKFDPQVIAVTGSNGKTTTKDMIHHLLSLKFQTLKNEGTKNNHIGLPLTLLNLNPEYKFVVLEMGTNHFGEIGYLSGLASPDLGLITNIGKAHLEYFDTPAKVYKEKISLKKHLKRGCYLILNNDDKFLKKTVFKNKITFGLGQNCDFSASNIKFSQAGYDFLVNGKYKMRLNCLGRQNIYNALAAICVARHYGIDFATISESIRDFKFPKMRLEYFKANGIEVINDAYNSNPDSLKLAIDTLADFTKKSRRILITADMLELGKKSAKFHEEMGSYIAQKGVIDLLISVGKFSKNLSGAAKKEGMSEAAVKSFDLLNGSISAITDSIKPGDVVLVKGSRMMQMERLVEAIKGKA